MENLILDNQWIIWLIVLWALPWKGVALWKSAKNSQKIWFVAILILNTAAVLEIIYIFFFSKRKKETSRENL